MKGQLVSLMPLHPGSAHVSCAATAAAVSTADAAKHGNLLHCAVNSAVLTSSTASAVHRGDATIQAAIGRCDASLTQPRSCDTARRRCTWQ